MDFSAPLWLFPLIAAPGLWLAARLYLSAGDGRRRGLAIPAGAAWLLLALLAVAPFWRGRAETWHPPLVVLAVDESPGYAALGARASAARMMAAARRHYEALGFRVVETGFAGRPVPGALPDPGIAALPNLQAVLLWTDGRLSATGEGDAAARTGSWPAPVFPVLVPASGTEAQGERAALDFAAAGGAALTVAWRSIGADGGAGALDAALELRDGENVLWTAALPHPAGATAGDIVTARLSLPPRLRDGPAASSPWTLLVRPAAAGGNATKKNDTVPIEGLSRKRPRHLFIRPLAALEERGLLDALREDSAQEAITVPAEAPAATRGDIVWINARAGSRAVRLAGGIAGEIPVIAYRLPDGDPVAGSPGFGPDARLAWRADGAEFLPPGALRLADLGLEGAVLRAPDKALEALAWAEGDDGRRGLLFWRESGAGAFGFAAPPLWRAGFRPGLRAGGASETAGRWTRGAAEWARVLAGAGGVRVTVPDPLAAGRAFSVTMAVTAAPRVSAKAGEPAPATLIHPFGTRRGARQTGAAGGRLVRFDSLVLPAGLHAASIRRGGDTVWRGVLRVRDPRDIALARLGRDAEALDRIARAGSGGGVVLDFSRHDLDSFPGPALPGGQVRTLRARAFPLAPPFAAALAIAVLLTAVWALRRRLRLD